MSSGLIDKLTNFLAPVENEESSGPESAAERRSALRVHSPAALKVYIGIPQSFDDVRLYADHLANGVAVVINFEDVDGPVKQRIADFLNGVSYVTGGTCQRVAEQVQLFVPGNVDVSKELYAFATPGTQYGKRN